jgi:hypothetical protein
LERESAEGFGKRRERGDGCSRGGSQRRNREAVGEEDTDQWGPVVSKKRKKKEKGRRGGCGGLFGLVAGPLPRAGPVGVMFPFFVLLLFLFSANYFVLFEKPKIV